MHRRFIWFEINNDRKYYVVVRKIVSMPKELGDLGFRRLDVMNKACILKLFWKLQTGRLDVRAGLADGKSDF
ncbi:hypothetical protein L195_g049451 [Trifolium pratense]|uniref:Uncharacterized protein n=1 Tax=Trifolium pratense TaxID=57577 RepID=A0A2K3JP80_TRIPR|nr:hypothetical protein L195_g049451 [Trifolium pratense]